MITLTTPLSVPSVLGGAGSLSYDKFVLDNLIFSPVSKTVTATVRLSCSADAGQPVLQGSLVINLNAGTLTLQVPDIPFRRVLTLNAGQVAAVQTYINTSQTSIEQGLVNLVVVSGAQSAGS